MKKVLTVILSFALLLGNCSPVYAQELSENVSVESQNESSTVTYVTVMKPQLGVGEEQNILIGLHNENMQMSDVTLILNNSTLDTQMELIVSDLNVESALFTAPMNDAGSYILSKITYQENGENKEIEMDTIGVEAQFGVDTEVPVEADAYVVDESQIEPQLDIVTLDENSEQTSEQSISEAIEDAQQDIATCSLSGRSITNNIVVVLDPGHGGTDPGATRTYGSTRYDEKDFNLAIAKYCRDELRTYAGVTVYMTREADTYIEIPDRIAYAKSVGASVVVSIHNNSSTNTSAHGAMVLYPTTNGNATIGQQGKELASTVQTELVKLGLANNGIVVRDCTDGSTYDDGTLMDYYGIIRRSKLEGFPGIIIEHAFISNWGDVSDYLTSDTQLKRMGVADATAIAQYYGLTQCVYEGVDYSTVFDPDYYIATYSDVRQAFGNDSKAALRHFVNYGMAEGREGRAEFDVKFYRDRYLDLQKAYGSNLQKYYLHFIHEGVKEGRLASNECDIFSYRGRYPELYNEYGDDYEAYYRDYIFSGKKQGKNATHDGTEYNVDFIVNGENQGTQSVVFGHSASAPKMISTNGATMQWDKAFAVVTSNLEVNGEWKFIYNGVDYSSVYNADYYLNKYNDVKKAYGNDPTKMLAHFVNYGMDEGRRGIEDFEVYSYRARNTDLRNAYGNNLKKYYMHYIDYGKNEGRDGSYNSSEYTVQFVSDGNVISTQNIMYGHPAKAPNVTKSGATLSWSPAYDVITEDTTVNAKWNYTYNGVDYSPIFDAEYYLNKYTDLKKAYGTDGKKALNHFLNYGMNEGRQGNEQFDVYCYRARYTDLQKAYGTDWKKLYTHYLNYGKQEMRDGTPDTDSYEVTFMNGNEVVATQQVVFGHSATAPQIAKSGATLSWDKSYNIITSDIVVNAQWRYIDNNVDYSSIFDADYYLNHYSDIKSAYGTNGTKALQHFINYGMKEGRQGKESFNVTSYKNRYSDLRNAFGSDLKKYFMHFLNYGQKEGRETTGYEKTVIGATTVYGGVDYSAVYDYNFYVTNNTDVFKAYGYDDQSVLSHFVNYGMKEGRQANADFNVNIYKDNNIDLQNVYGQNMDKYYIHYVQYGKNEGRIAK